ncbi:hypothetical protein DFH08DRAFT_736492 [Mycena albidolilacea]|uniref:Uncharacterized protein n=1 Tax=Mycena albidolilacea TaxID=1033008 RepID=A0AAD7AFG4_9AGAR|nr:hypothetical protein DFH08DRAFT_736492 [Mycena albidolilacea]
MASRSFDSADPHSDFKPAYDDGDLAFSSYARTPQHQTFNVGAPQSQHTNRGPFQPQFSSKNSDDTSHDLVPVAYPPPPPQKEVDGRGFWEKILPESMACRLYVLTVLIETTIDLVIEGELLLQINKNAKGNFAEQQMPVYLSIFALAHVFQFVLAVDAVYARNTLQFICLTIFNALFLAYAVIQIGEIRELNIASTGHVPIDVLTTTIPIVIALAEVAYIALGWKIYDEFGWKVYKFLGADRRIKKMYAHYQIYECLVKFDVFFWVGFSVQFIWLVLVDHNWEYYVTCAALPLSLILLIEGHLAARHESKMMMLTFISGCGSAMIYFVYKLVKVLRLRHTEDFISVWKTLTIFSVIAIILLAVTFVFSIMVLRNFGRGLKDLLMKKNMSHSRDPSQHHRAASQNPHRMSIN